MSLEKVRVLEFVPDWDQWEVALAWIREGLKKVGTLNQRQLEILLKGNQMQILEWADLQDQSHSTQEFQQFGLYSSKNWRKWVLSCFLADLASYSVPVDQVNFERLAFVMNLFPKGFRIFWLKMDETWWPVGYSAWYPMFELQFEVFEKSPGRLRDRMVTPDTYSKNEHPFIYLFNYSAISAAKGTPLTKELLSRYSKDLERQNYRGLACITVSEDGRRVAQRFGMDCSGELKIRDSVEHVFAKRFG